MTSQRGQHSPDARRMASREASRRADQPERRSGGSRADAWRRRLEALASRRIGAWTAGLALLLTLRALWGGWHFDDYIHRAQLLGLEMPGVPVAETSLFGFVTGDVESTRSLIDAGFMPWWTLETLRFSFWRPLASATHALDYTLWPDSAPAMHAHSLLWFALLVLVVSALYRRFLGSTWIAGLATLLYALDDARGLPAAWLANRNSLIAGVFCVLAIWAHDRWRRDAWRPGAILAPASLALSLLATEMGIATLAYLASYALFLDRGPGRVTALLGHGAVAAVWLLAYQAGGYGAAGSGIYTSPLSEPVAFLAEFVRRFPVLLLDQLGPPVPQYGIVSPGAQAGLAWTGAVVAALVALALAPLLRRDPVARFWALGCVLSLVPVTSALPTSRLLMLSGLGAMGLIAQFIAFAFTSLARTTPRWRRGLITSCAVLFVFFHGIVGPLFLPLVVWGHTLEVAGTNAMLSSAPLEGAIEQKTLVLVNPPFVPVSLVLPLFRRSSGLAAPRYLRALAPGLTDVRVERPDPRTLVVTPGDGFLSGRLGSLFRAPEYPMSLGQSVALTGMRATVVGLGADGGPARVEFRFDRSLEDPDLIWLCFANGRFTPFQPPEVGQEVVLAGAMRAVE